MSTAVSSAVVAVSFTATGTRLASPTARNRNMPPTVSPTAKSVDVGGVGHVAVAVVDRISTRTGRCDDGVLGLQRRQHRGVLTARRGGLRTRVAILPVVLLAVLGVDGHAQPLKDRHMGLAGGAQETDQGVAAGVGARHRGQPRWDIRRYTGS